MVRFLVIVVVVALAGLALRLMTCGPRARVKDGEFRHFHVVNLLSDKTLHVPHMEHVAVYGKYSDSYPGEKIKSGGRRKRATHMQRARKSL
jgi:hypothetical protein